jgi:hypothetical protein
MLYKLQFTRIRVIGQFHKISKKYLKYLLSMSFVLDIIRDNNTTFDLLLDLLRNSTSAGNLCVIPVLKSSRTLEYAAVFRSVSPTNSLTEANFARGLLNNCVI